MATLPGYRTAYRTVDVDGLSVFYREASPQDAPTILLLHGFPSSSRMWQTLLDRLDACNPPIDKMLSMRLPRRA